MKIAINIALFCVIFYLFDIKIKLKVNDPRPTMADTLLTKPSTLKADSLIVRGDISEADKIAFLKRFAQISMAEGRKYYIPSSCILAIAALKSDYGRSKNVIGGNNYFNLNRQDQDQKFRVYDNSWSSFRDFSLVVTSVKVAILPNSDYKDFLKQLDKSNLYKDDIADKTIEIIEKYKLSKLDNYGK